MRASLKCNYRSALTLAALLLVPTLLTACGKESIADAVTRQKDRERENASVVSTEYDLATGSYGGNFVSQNVHVRGKTSGYEGYDVRAFLKTVRVHKDGSLLPQPVISGSFILTNKTLRTRTGEPVTTVFAFTNGSYDSATHQLSVEISSVQGSSPAIEVNCKRSSNEDPVFHCYWLSLVGSFRMEFDLAHTQKQD